MQHDFVKPLMLWYNNNARDLAWRRTGDPYKIWISEIMLQQTRVEAVKAYYERFLTALPDIDSLAQCPESELLKLWEGLGYYTRARNLKKAAVKISEEHSGVFPGDFAEVLELPGIGSYTAGAVCSFSFGTRTPAVDGNVLRVYARLTGLEENVLLPKVKHKVEEELKDILMNHLPEDAGNWQMEPGNDTRNTDRNPAGLFNQAMIELGALVCVPNGKPLCDMCPVREFCEAQREGKTDRIPVRLKKTGRKKEPRTVLVLREGERFLIERRSENGMLAGMYEFPNVPGHLDESEARSAAISEGFTPLEIRKLPAARHIFSHVEWDMIGYEIRVKEGDKGRRIFADPSEIEQMYPIPTAFQAYTRAIGIRTGMKNKRIKE